jgi:hypothetical protein
MYLRANGLGPLRRSGRNGPEIIVRASVAVGDAILAKQEESVLDRRTLRFKGSAGLPPEDD